MIFQEESGLCPTLLPSLTPNSIWKGFFWIMRDIMTTVFCSFLDITYISIIFPFHHSYFFYLNRAKSPGGVYSIGLEPASVRPSVHTFKHEYLWDQLADRNQIKGLAALRFGSDRIGTLVSIATDNSHWVIMGKSFYHSSSFIFDRFFFIRAGNWTTITSWMGSKFDRIRPVTDELDALGRLEKSP